MKRRTVRHLGFRCVGPTMTPARVMTLRRWLRTGEHVVQQRRLLAAIAGRSRFAILALLRRERELCVCDLADVLGTTVSAVSHQLTALREHRLVRTRRDGTTLFYSLTGSGMRALRALSSAGV